MRKLSVVLTLVGVLQIVLGLGYLFAPQDFLAAMGHSRIAADIAYPFGMLAARFLVYGGLLIAAARAPSRHALLIDGMAWIQLIDLAAGLYFTLTGVVPVSLSGFPMFNATWIALVLFAWRPAADARLAKA